MPTKNNGRTQPVAGRATITKLVDPLTDVPYKNRSAVGISSRAIAKDRNFIGNGRHHAMINLSPTSDAPILVPGINSNYLLKTGRERVVQAATPALAAVAAIIRRVEEVFARIGAPFTRNVISAQVRSKILGDEGKGLGSNNIDQHQQLNRILPGISSKIDLDIGELQREAFMKIAVVFQLIPAEETKWHEISGIFGDESDPASEGLELTGVLKSNTRHEAREDESNQLARIIGISLENTPGLEVVTEGDKTTVKLSVVNLRANFARMILRTHDSMAPHFPKKRIATPPIPEVTQA